MVYLSRLPNRSLVSSPLVTVDGLPGYGDPAWLAYDHADRQFYAAVAPSSLDVISNASAPTVTNAIPVGSSPFGVAVDNLTGDIFVTNTGSDNVSVVSAAGAQVGSVHVGSQPYGLAYDWTTDEIYVANFGSDNVTIISGSTLRALDTVAVGEGPIGVAYDPATGHVFVADNASSQVTIISSATHGVVGTVAVPQGPYAVAVDSVADWIYVTDPGASSVTVISATNGSVIFNIPVTALGGMNLQGVAFDPVHNAIWIAAGRYAVVINPSNQFVAAILSWDPSGVVYDPDSGSLCVTNSLNSSFSCIIFPSQYPWTDSVSLTFDEAGLPLTTSWNVTISFGSHSWTGTSQSSTVEFPVFPGQTFGYEAWPTTGYSAQPAFGSVAIPASNTTVNITYTYAPGPFSVTFQESGLPSGTTWGVTFGGIFLSSSTTTLTFSQPSGTYGYRVEPVNGWYEVSEPVTGLIAVNGADVQASLGYAPVLYSVTFSESGLTLRAPWTVTLNSATVTTSSATITFNEANGSYSYLADAGGYVVFPGNLSTAYGNVSVIGGDVRINLTFVRAFAVTFGETGLAAGEGWGVTLNGVKGSSTTNEITFLIPNGSFYFSVATTTGYYPTPAWGTVVVNGLSVGQGITFRGVAQVKFRATGLPAGSNWSVTTQVAGGWNVTSGRLGKVVLAEPPGFTSFSVNPPAGYGVARVTSRSPHSIGSINVSAVSDAATLTVHFGAWETLWFNETFGTYWPGLPSGSVWNVTLTPRGNGGPPGQFASNTTYGSSGSVSFSVAKGTRYAFVTSPPAGYAVKVQHGRIKMPGHNKTKWVRFRASALSPVSVPYAFGSLPLFSTFGLGLILLATRTSRRSEAAPRTRRSWSRV